MSQVQLGDGRSKVLMRSLLTLLNSHSRLYISQRPREKSCSFDTDSCDEVESNRFEADMRRFDGWFSSSQDKIKPKLEFFFVPYIRNQRLRTNTINNIKCRRTQYFENIKRQQLLKNCEEHHHHMADHCLDSIRRPQAHHHHKHSKHGRRPAKSKRGLSLSNERQTVVKHVMHG